MVFTDKQLGTIGVVMSITGLLYLFLMLMIIPILPLEDENPLLLFSPSVSILTLSGILGFIFVGSLAIFTITMMHFAE